MGMLFLFGLLVLGFWFFTSIVLPWVTRSRVADMEQQLTHLKKQQHTLCVALELHGIALPPELLSQPKIWAWQQQAAPVPPNPAPTIAPAAPEPKPASATPAPTPTITAELVSSTRSFEQQFGARLPVWIGGVALALAGFFLVKYSIETGLLSPLVRIVLGLLFGIGLLRAASWVRERPGIANGARIGQSLTGAGIADLYVCLFAATSLYGLLPPAFGFILMAAVTATAVVLSLRHGMPIAILGLVGGFLTPALVGSHDPNVPVLFLYLYFVVSGLLTVSRKRAWWGLAIPTILGAFVWVCLWLFGSGFAAGDTIYLGLFLLAISATVVITSKSDYEAASLDVSDALRMTSALNYLSLGGAMLVMGIMTMHAGFSLMDWGMFALISLGGIALAYHNQRLYGLAPWLSMGINAVMLLSWQHADSSERAVMIAAFGALYIISGYLLQSRSEKPLLWAGLTVAASLGYYLIGYGQLHPIGFAAGIPALWSLLALAFAAAAVYVTHLIVHDVPEDHPQKQHLLALYAAAGTAFVALALTIALPREFLSVAFAIELLAILWINTQVSVKALRQIAGALACVFGFLLLPQILLLVQLTAYSLMEAKLTLQQGIPLVDWPLFQLGLPAMCFVGGSYLLRQTGDGKLVRALEIAAISLIAVMGYYLTRHAFHVDENVLFVKAGFVERGVITNILFVYGLTCLWLGRHYLRSAVTLSGLVLSGVAMFRIGYFDLIAYNPLWSAQTVGEFPIINALLLTYGLSILWTMRLTSELATLKQSRWVRYTQGFTLLLAFTLLSLSIRQLFHGALLNDDHTSNAEIYSYSVAWLLFGIGLLFYGTLRGDKMIRIASLIVMLLTVGKVFLYDASELEGLFRVFSFFGLGLSLIGLSWFYTRFVFTREGENH